MKTRSQTARSAPFPLPDWTWRRQNLQPAPGTTAPKVSSAAAHLFHLSALLLLSARHSNPTQFTLAALFLFLLSAKRLRPSLFTHVTHSICFTCHIETCKIQTPHFSAVKRGRTSPSRNSGRFFYILAVIADMPVTQKGSRAERIYFS